MTVTLSGPVWLLLGICIVVGGVVLSEKLGKSGFALAREAKARGKWIELVAAAAAFCGLLYGMTQLDALSDRVTSLERSVETLKALQTVPRP